MIVRSQTGVVSQDKQVDIRQNSACVQVLGVDASSLPQLVITALPKFAAKPLPDQSLAVTTFLQDMRAGNVDVNTLE